MRPRYQILTIVYAPPGTNGGRSSSSVDYGHGSSTGTTTTTSNSFKSGVDVSVKAGDDDLSATADFNASVSLTDTASVDIKKSQNYDIKVNGPAKDGIDHDHDLFYLWLNPLVKVDIFPGNKVGWGIGVDGPTMLIQYVYAGWLKNPNSMPPGVQRELAAAGLTPSDYTNILSTNPFTSGAAAIDHNRFLLTTQSFPYEPPFGASDSVPTTTLSMQNSVTNTTTHKVDVQYGVKVTVSANIADLIELKATGSLDWTDSSSQSTSTGSTQSASVTVGGPAFGYAGPTNVLVYWDTVFHSFMFALTNEVPSAAGTLTDRLGKPVVHQLVRLAAGPLTFSTFTDARGGFRFYGAPPGQGRVIVGARELPAVIRPGAPHIAVQI
jgi:hypothetical protein